MSQGVKSVSVEPLDFADILQLNETQWKNYETDWAFVHLRTIGPALHDGTLNHVLFSININNIHWAAIEVNAIDRSISYADSLDWSNHTPAWQQQDSFSCGITAINTIKHALFCDPLFTDDRAFSLCMEEFLHIAYNYLELSNPNDDLNDSLYSDSNDFEMEETQPLSHNDQSWSPSSPTHDQSLSPSSPTLPIHPPHNKLKVNLHTSDANRSTGLFKFFPMVSHDEHLKLAWKPSTWELKDQEQQEWAHYQKRLDMFEKTAHKHERAAECKRKQQACEKATKQKLSIDSVLHDSNP
ncbi:hypothetical protein BDR04DRAFT_1162071 [Suillus decipiens]|nr:hypothetical protein BDR04DRAFT_1162071 [Suillus decipiens]